MPADPSGDRAHAVWHYRYPYHPAMGEAVFAAVHESGFGTKQTYRGVNRMSAFGGILL
jgi:hypothetical protein